MKSKVVTAAEAVSKIPDGACIALGGVGGGGMATEIVESLAARFDKEQHPGNVSVMHAGGNQTPRFLCKEGFMSAYYSGLPSIDSDLIKQNLFPVYSFSQGIILQLFRAQANDSPYLTRAGVNTFVDPRVEAGAANEKAAASPVVEVVTIKGEEYLHIDLPPITVAVIRGTTADTEGNLTFEEETVKHEALYVAMAAHNHGGIVIAQAKYIAPAGSLPGAEVKVPGMLVDYVVPYGNAEMPKMPGRPGKPDGAEKPGKPEGAEKPQRMAMPDFLSMAFGPGLTGYHKVDESIIPLESYKPDGDRLITVRRAAEELRPGYICNIGIGIPVGIAYIASKERIHEMFTLTNEMGAIGGHMGGGMFFSNSFNARAYLHHHEMFDFINGHGLDISFLGAAEIDEDGSVNVTKIAGRIHGSGGFVNISASTRKIVFLSSFTVGGKSTGENGALKILEQGKSGKFLKKVDQLSFNGKDAVRRGQEIVYVTERAVFKLIGGKVTLIEYADGLDIQKDILDFMDFKPEISPDLKKMPTYCFEDGVIGMKEQWEKMGL